MGRAFADGNIGGEKMKITYQKAVELFGQSRINELARSDTGFRFLLLRSLSRADILRSLARECGSDLSGVPARALLEVIYDLENVTTRKILEFIGAQYDSERKNRLANEPRLIHQLYQIKEFDWGGLYQNNLEKNIVDNYVKKIPDYKKICRAIDEKLFPSLRSYTLCSWYNHWTSIIIEDIFNDHEDVIPAIGKIKQVDFFLGNVPYDLKVTRFPEEYIALQRKKERLRPELTLLKQICRQHSLPISQELSSSRLLEDLWKKVSDHPSKEAEKLIVDMSNFRIKLLNSTKNNPIPLITWYYENQGERRFDASNRLFLILVDSSDFFNSWQLKRAKDLIRQEAHASLSKIKKQGGRKIDFLWNQSRFTTISDVIFVLK